MNFRRIWCLVSACACLIYVSPTRANETTNYTYDALGRLVARNSSGTVNNGMSMNAAFDAAGNRTNYAVAGVGSGPMISIADASANEGETLAFTITRSGSTTSTVSARWTTSNGSALDSVNYTANAGMVMFGPGEISKTISVATIDDFIFEPTKTMSVILSSPTNDASLGNTTATGTIFDHDTPVNIAIGNASVTEGQTLNFPISRTGNTSLAASVSYFTSNGSAIAGRNYTASSGTVYFSANQTSATISIPTIDDTVATPTETMTVTIANPSAGAAITVPTATGYIADNDSTWLTLNSGSWDYSDDYGTYSYTGYMPARSIGSLSSTTYNGCTIQNLYTTSGLVIFQMSGSSTPPNSGWNTINIPGIGVLNRSSASYSTSGNTATWQWYISGSSISSGNLIIQ